MVNYTIRSMVTDRKITTVPRSGQTVSGYGGRIPTQHMVRYANRWHRVRVMVYGNAGSAYITVGGQDLFLDTDTEYFLTLPLPQGTIWVCDDCMLARENDEQNDGRPDTEPEPWALEPTTDVTMGLMTEDHECDDPRSGECSCERREFSWSACEGCGSTLGGSRYAYTYWF